MQQKPNMEPEFPLYRQFSVGEWSQLRENTPMVLDESDLERVRGINEHISVEEVEAVFLPISRLLNLQFQKLKIFHLIFFLKTRI